MLHSGAAADRPGLPPDVGIVVGHPAAHAVEVLGDVGPVHAELLGQLHQRQVALARFAVSTGQ